MTSYFRKRNHGGGLPLTSGAPSAPASTPSVFGFPSQSSLDGSARSIHLESPMLTKWKRSSKAMKTTFIILVVSAAVAYFGWRILSYHHASVGVQCTSTECQVSLVPQGRGRRVRLEVPRHQIVGAKAVKVNAQGVLVNDSVNINEEWKYYTAEENKKSKKKKSASNNYKGPDKDGNYLTYALLLRSDPDNPTTNADGKEVADVNLDSLSIYATREKAENVGHPNSLNIASTATHRIILRQQGMVQSRRRVRNMVQKIESYAKKRRQKLSVKESTAPDWRGVLMMVLGCIAFFLTILLAQFWEDEEAYTVPGAMANAASGPGARRNHNNSKSSQNTHNPYQRQTPSRYEVASAPRKITHSQTAAHATRRRN